MGHSRSSSSSSSSSDDHKVFRSSGKVERFSRSSSGKKVQTCNCTVVHQESSAILKNIVLEATVDLAVLERIKLDVPLKTNCVVRNAGVKPTVVEKRPKPAVVRDNKQATEESSQTTTTTTTVTTTTRKSDGSEVKKVEKFEGPTVTKTNVENTSNTSARRSITMEKQPSQPAAGNEIFKIVIEVNDLPKMDSFINGGSADPYFYFYLDKKLFFGGRDKAIKNSRKGQWSFPILASLVRNAQKITIKWFDFDNIGKDDEIGTTEIDVSRAIRNILNTSSNKCVTNMLPIKGKNCEKANVSITVERVLQK